MLGTTAMSARGSAPDRATGEYSLVVVVPVRNEEMRLGRCLDALERARRRACSGLHTRSSVRVVVVLDRCTDRSAQIAASRSWIETVVTDHGRVGAARAAGVDYALARATQPPARIWIACTDGDSVVPADWLLTHRAHAASGADLLLGTVRPDPAELSSAALRQWYSEHLLVDGHRHVFGANLGISAQMYTRAGGFADVRADEDVQLVTAVRRLRGRVVSTASSPVLTSGRLVGRTGAGFAEYLGEMRSETTDSDPDRGAEESAAQSSSPAAPATEMAGGRT